MARLLPAIFGLALLALWVWAVLDVIATERSLARNLNKVIWLVLVVFVPTLGAVAWIALGRPVGAGFSPGATINRPQHRQQQTAPRGIEDSEYWSAMTKTAPPGASDGFETTAARERRLREEQIEANLEAQLEDETESENDPPL